MSAEWKVGMCGCCTNTSTCLDHCCCTPCMLSRHWMAVDDQRDTCSVPICCAANCFGPIILLLTRRKIVEKYNIDEGCIGSLCKCCLCGGLLTCQHHYELTAQGTWPGGQLCEKQPPM